MMRLLPVLVVVSVMPGQVPAAPPPPNLSGVWVLEGFYGRGPLGLRNFRSVCELPAGMPVAPGASTPATDGPQESPGGEQVQSIGNVDGELVISQTPTLVTVDRLYRGSVAGGSHKDVFKLDGSESVTTVGVVRSTTRNRWEGPSLVVEHRLRWTAASGDAGCDVRETFSLTNRDTLALLATRTDLEGPQTANQTYVRKRERSIP